MSIYLRGLNVNYDRQSVSPMTVVLPTQLSTLRPLHTLRSPPHPTLQQLTIPIPTTHPITPSPLGRLPYVGKVSDISPCPSQGALPGGSFSCPEPRSSQCLYALGPTRPLGSDPTVPGQPLKRKWLALVLLSHRSSLSILEA